MHFSDSHRIDHWLFCAALLQSCKETTDAHQQISRHLFIYGFSLFFIKSPLFHGKLLNAPSVQQFGLTDKSLRCEQSFLKRILLKFFKVHLCKWWSEAVERGWMNESEPFTTWGLHPGCLFLWTDLKSGRHQFLVVQITFNGIKLNKHFFPFSFVSLSVWENEHLSGLLS